MSSQSESELIHIIITIDDVTSMAEETGIELETALERARDWASAIEDTAVELILNQLYSVVEFDNP